MAITPQAIKDQEFQVKLRGYDTVEVKAYLDLIAEEFFELLEQVRQQVDDLEVIAEQRDTLKAETQKLENELATIQDSSAEVKTESAEREAEFAALLEEIDRLKADITTLETQVSGKDQEIAEAQTRIKRKEDAVDLEKERNEKLTRRLDDLEKQNEELRSEEIDFKSTLVAAQQFTNELKKKSEQEARDIVDKAKADAEQLRQDTFAELAKYPAEIERLKARKREVRDDLEQTLKLCLENLDIFRSDDENEDYGELFRTLQEEGRVPEAEGEWQDEGDDLDSLNVDFDLPGSRDDRGEETFSMKDELDKSGDDIP